ncbi:MAG: amidase family protein, partial [Candidatus Omnitrophica bacterium]|nr:amidase family protein [Candidatus Omnitrophota bacterium]
MELNQLTAHELIDKLKGQQTTASSVLDALYSRIQKVEPAVKAYVRVEEAKKPVLKPQPGSLLKGLPITIKDNICTEGINTECCSKILQGFRPPYDATVIKKLKNAGAE